MEAERIVKNIQINMIKPNNYQPRKYFSQDSLIELSRSIKEYGVLQPISVRKNGEKFYVAYRASCSPSELRRYPLPYTFSILN
jgi:ParB/RepB/Spo0J family partition protein